MRHEEGGGRVGDEGARQTLGDKLVRCQASALVEKTVTQTYCSMESKAHSRTGVNASTLFERRSNHPRAQGGADQITRLFRSAGRDPIPKYQGTKHVFRKIAPKQQGRPARNTAFHCTRAAFIQRRTAFAVHVRHSPYTYSTHRTRAAFIVKRRDRPPTPNLVVRPSFRAKASLQHPLLGQSADNAQSRPEAGGRQSPCTRK